MWSGRLAWPRLRQGAGLSQNGVRNDIDIICRGIGVISAHPAGFNQRIQPTGSAHGPTADFFARTYRIRNPSRRRLRRGLQSLTAPEFGRSVSGERRVPAGPVWASRHGHRPAKPPDTGEPGAIFATPSEAASSLDRAAVSRHRLGPSFSLARIATVPAARRSASPSGRASSAARSCWSLPRCAGGHPVSKRHLKIYVIVALLGASLPNSLFYFAAPHVQAGVLSIMQALIPILTYGMPGHGKGWRRCGSPELSSARWRSRCWCFLTAACRAGRHPVVLCLGQRRLLCVGEHLSGAAGVGRYRTGAHRGRHEHPGSRHHAADHRPAADVLSGIPVRRSNGRSSRSAPSPPSPTRCSS